MNCACGCGEQVPTPPRGGYHRYLQRSIWFASNECMARYETAALQVKHDYPLVFAQADTTQIERLITDRLEGRTRPHE